MQQGIAKQPGQVSQGPAVCVIDDQQQPRGLAKTHVLAAWQRQNRTRAVGSSNDLPPCIYQLLCDPAGQSGLALSTRRVQPSGCQSRAGLRPCSQVISLAFPAGEADDGVTGVEHPARQLPQPMGIDKTRSLVVLQHIDRNSITQYVQVGADHTIGKPGYRCDVLHDSARRRWSVHGWLPADSGAAGSAGPLLGSWA